MVEAHRSADLRGRFATGAVPKDLVTVADVLTLELENPGRGSPSLTSQRVPLAVWHQREVPRLEPGGVGLIGLEQRSPRDDDVEPDVSRHRHQRQTPRGAELGAAIEGAVHAYEVQCLAHRVIRRPRVERGHATSMPRV